MLLCTVLALANLAQATETDVLGGTDTYNNNSVMLKVIQVDVRHPVAITGFRFFVYADRDSRGTPVLVLYKQNGDTFELVEQIDGTDLPTDGEGWATATPSWVLEEGASYAIGAWMPDGWYYAYSDRTADPWFGRVSGSYRYESDSPPPTFQADRESYYYYMEVDSEDADVDSDGVISQDWGGTDCDDTNPDVGEASVEVPYDGIDQDCDGSDLTDVDGDGGDAEEVGGTDCNDNDDTIQTGATEICGDGIDQDCDGVDPDCSGDNGGNGGDNGGNGGDNGGNGGVNDTAAGSVDVSPGGCGCASAPEAPVSGLLGLALAFAARRRRG